MEEMHEVLESTGNIKISEEVVATIAGIAVSEVKGVCTAGGSTLSGEINKMLGKKGAAKGVRVVVNDRQVTLDINVIIEYGVRIPEVAWEIQENVKKSIESMTGLDVNKVNIHVVGIEMAKETPVLDESDDAEEEEPLEE